MGDSDIQKLRAALARRARGRGKRYTANLRQRIAEAATVLRGRGHGWHTIGRFFGIPHETVRRFGGGRPATAFVPVEVEGSAGVGLSLVTPDGYRVEGLAAIDVAEILRRLR
jgi:hypothetical protein